MGFYAYRSFKIFDTKGIGVIDPEGTEKIKQHLTQAVVTIKFLVKVDPSKATKQKLMSENFRLVFI